MIDNIEWIVSRSDFKGIEELPGLLTEKFGDKVLRWFISKVTDQEVCLEITLSEKEEFPFSGEAALDHYPGKSAVVNIIPTGVGCEIGGYAADAAPATALLASCVDYVVTNPNAVNASNFISMPDNVLYTEGLMIDRLCRGLVNLYRPYSNKVGLIIDHSSREELDIIFNIMNTVRAIHGVDLEHYVVTDQPIGGRCVCNKSGSYVGRLDDTSVLFNACEDLISRGVNAIAVTSHIRDLPMEDYALHFDGQHPNPVGGAEAIISHLIGAKYRVPCAHAPLINIKEMNLKSNIVDARGAGEFSSASGLACVLVGLSRAPHTTTERNRMVADAVNINNVLAVTVPASTLGGIPIISALQKGIPVIAVKQNGTILDVHHRGLELPNIIEVNNYAEAAGVIQALKSGISLQSIYRPLETLRS